MSKRLTLAKKKCFMRLPPVLRQRVKPKEASTGLLAGNGIIKNRA